jgi:DcmR-like sensory protein
MASLMTSSEPVEPRANHLVHFYGEDDSLLARSVAEYLWQGLNRGEELLVVATPDHCGAFAEQLSELGADPSAAVRERRLVFLDAQQTLAGIMVGEQPDWQRFDDSVGTLAREVQSRPGHSGLRAYGEMVGLLWTAKQFSAAIRLEEFWNQLILSLGFQLFCAYPIDILDEEFRPAALDGVLCAHTRVLPTGMSEDLQGAILRAMRELLGLQADQLKIPLLDGQLRGSWPQLPPAEGMVLWLRETVPDYAQEILARARQYYRSNDVARSDRRNLPARSQHHQASRQS